MIFAPDCDLKGAGEIAERLLAMLRNPPPAEREDETRTFTVSIGISVANHRDADFDAMYRRADTALYEAKSQGKNRYAVCINTAASFPI